MSQGTFQLASAKSVVLATLFLLVLACSRADAANAIATYGKADTVTSSAGSSGRPVVPGGDTAGFAPPDSAGCSVVVDRMVVTAKRRATADAESERIVPSLGATKRTITRAQIEDQSQGDNAPFDQTLYRFPGVAQDELDKRLHVRGEEANLQYRINDFLLPDGLSGFGQELGTRFVDQLSLIVGTLPAQYGGRTAGVVDIRTKSGADARGGSMSMYAGSCNTFNPAFEYGGSIGNCTYYATGSFLHNSMGMANPSAGVMPLHDETHQYKGFGMLSWFVDNSSRLSIIASGAYGDFQLPDIPGQNAGYVYDSLASFQSSSLNENQREQSYYEIIAYQKKADNFSLQLSQTGRYGDVLFIPDTIGDLMFNGVAARSDHSLVAGGISLDASLEIDEHHTLRGGMSATVERAAVRTSNLVFPAGWNDSAWAQTGVQPLVIDDDSRKTAWLYSCYLQDEWRLVKDLTVNYGLRFEGLNAYLNEYQASPRLNIVYRPFLQTTLHAGYGMYFTPPPVEFVSTTSIGKFDNTTYAADPANSQSSPVQSERYHYFDIGMTQQIVPGLEAGFEGYYKLKRHVLDEGQFGPAMIFSPNNADRGYVRGVELTINCSEKDFSGFGNFAYCRAMAYGLESGQFQFPADELGYLQTHWYHLDHDQDITASLGAAYKRGGARIYADALYGSGLYGGFCNTRELPQYLTVNVGAEYRLKMRRTGALKARFDVVNLFDLTYEIRNGDGIGVFAPQYLPRRGLYGGLAWEF